MKKKPKQEEPVIEVNHDPVQVMFEITHDGERIDAIRHMLIRKFKEIIEELEAI